MHKGLFGICSSVQWLSSNGTVWKSSSSSFSFSRFTGVFPEVAVGVDGVTPGVLSSSDELNDSYLHIGLGGACKDQTKHVQCWKHGGFSAFF